jgi:hypothetical protein
MITNKVYVPICPYVLGDPVVLVIQMIHQITMNINAFCQALLYLSSMHPQLLAK